MAKDFIWNTIAEQKKYQIHEAYPSYTTKIYK